MMSVDDYDPSRSLSAYFPDREERRLARLWAREKVLHDFADFGAVEFFEGSGTDPTQLDGYATNKLWLRVEPGVTEEPGEIRYFKGGDASLLESWPVLTREGFASHLGARAGAEFDYVWSDETGGDPGTGRIRGNHESLGSITELALSKTGRQGQDYGTRLLAWLSGDTVRVYGVGDESSYVDVRLDGDPADQGDYVTVACEVLTSSTLADGQLAGVAHYPTREASAEQFAQQAAASAQDAAQSAADAASSAASAVEVTGALPRVNRSTLKALDTDQITVAYVTEPGREGMFRWRTGNYSTLVSADTQEGVYIKADDVAASSGAWERVVEGPLNVLWFGADRTGASDSSAAVQGAIDLASALMDRPKVYLPRGTYLFDSTVEIGAHHLCGDGLYLTKIKPGMTDGSPAIDVTGGADNYVIEGLWIQGTVNNANFDAGTEDPQDCIGLRAVNSSSNYPARYTMRDVIVTGCDTGMDIEGWVAKIDNVHIQRCSLGFKGALLNNAYLDLRLEFNRQDLELTDSDGVTFASLIMEGVVANTLASTIDDCHGVVFTSPYFEASSGQPRSEPFLVMGGTTECSGIEMLGITVGSSSGLQAGVYPIKLDKVNGGQITGRIAEGTQRATIETTANTKDVRVRVTTSSGSFVQDASAGLAPAFNYFPNPAFEAWFRGWRFVETANATLSQETTLVRRGRYALKVAATVSTNGNRVRFGLQSQIYEGLRGKTIRAGAWIWVPDIEEFQQATRTALAGLSLQATNGVDVVQSPAKNSSFLAGAWNFFWSSDLAVLSDATDIELSVYVNQSATNASGDEFIVIDSIMIAESSVPLERLMRGELMDSPLLPSFAQGRLIAYGTAAPNDTDQVFEAGDMVLRTNPSNGQNMGWMCTSGGSPGTWGVLPSLAS